jgi:hypothetical protein
LNDSSTQLNLDENRLTLPLAPFEQGRYISRKSILRVFLARRTRGNEDAYIDTNDVLKLLIVGDSAVRLLVTLGARSAW